MKRKNGTPQTPEEIKAAVAQRQAEIQKKIVEGNDDLEINSKFIQDCLFCNEMGHGILYAALLHDKYRFNKNSKEWLIWRGHYWERDILDEGLADVEAD